MGFYDIIFYLFAAITIVSAAIVVNSKNIIHSAFSLALTFFGVSGLYALMGADFISVVQIMVYVGGILILLLFGVMLTNKITDVDIKSGVLNVFPAILGLGIFGAILIFIMTSTNWHEEKLKVPETTTKMLGNLLLTDYVLVFELLAILLLIALIGAASIARRDNKEE